jgi:hypothetical protein
MGYNGKCMSSGGLRRTSLSPSEKVDASHKLGYLLLLPPLLIHIVPVAQLTKYYL